MQYTNKRLQNRDPPGLLVFKSIRFGFLPQLLVKYLIIRRPWDNPLGWADLLRRRVLSCS